jgi:hypothetical protein
MCFVYDFIVCRYSLHTRYVKQTVSLLMHEHLYLYILGFFISSWENIENSANAGIGEMLTRLALNRQLNLILT